jgi:hypothetical protein
MTIEQKITEINTAITNEIAKLRITIPGEESKLWKVKLYGKCIMREQMDKGRECLIEVETKQWVTADDSLDFIVAHVYSEDGQNNHDYNGYDFSRIGFDERLKLIVLSKKKMAFPLVFEALKGVHLSVLSRKENYNEVTKEYMTAHAKGWGVNPDYRGLIVEYKVNIPYLDEPDYTVID